MDSVYPSEGFRKSGEDRKKRKWKKGESYRDGRKEREGAEGKVRYRAGRAAGRGGGDIEVGKEVKRKKGMSGNREVGGVR